MPFKCEDVEVGDVLRCVANGGNCCYALGDEFEVFRHEGRLVFRPKCYEQHREFYVVAEFADRTTFELRKMSGPW